MKRSEYQRRKKNSWSWGSAWDYGWHDRNQAENSSPSIRRQAAPPKPVGVVGYVVDTVRGLIGRKAKVSADPSAGGFYANDTKESPLLSKSKRRSPSLGPWDMKEFEYRLAQRVRDEKAAKLKREKESTLSEPSTPISLNAADPSKPPAKPLKKASLIPPLIPPLILPIKPPAALSPSVTDYLTKFNAAFIADYQRIKTIVPEEKLKSIKDQDTSDAVRSLSGFGVTRKEVLMLKVLLIYEGLDDDIKAKIMATEPTEEELKRSGVTRIDALKMRLAAIANDTVFGFRPINTKSAELMDEGAMGKLFSTKGKSSVLVPFEGSITFNSWFSKACDLNKSVEENRGNVAEFQEENSLTINRSNEQFYKMMLTYLFDLEGIDYEKAMKDLTAGAYAAKKKPFEYLGGAKQYDGHEYKMMKKLREICAAKYGADADSEIMILTDYEAIFGSVQTGVLLPGASVRETLVNRIITELGDRREDPEEVHNKIAQTLKEVFLKKAQEKVNNEESIDREVKRLSIKKEHEILTDFVTEEIRAGRLAGDVEVIISRMPDADKFEIIKNFVEANPPYLNEILDFHAKEKIKIEEISGKSTAQVIGEMTAFDKEQAVRAYIAYRRNLRNEILVTYAKNKIRRESIIGKTPEDIIANMSLDEKEDAIRAHVTKQQQIKFDNFIDDINIIGLADRTNSQVEINGVKCDVFFITKDANGDSTANPEYNVDGVNPNLKEPILIAKFPRADGGFDYYEYSYVDNKYLKIDDARIDDLCDIFAIPNSILNEHGDESPLNAKQRRDIFLSHNLKHSELVSYVGFDVKRDKVTGKITSVSRKLFPVTADYDRIFEGIKNPFSLDNNEPSTLVNELRRSVTVLKGEEEKLKAILIKFGIMSRAGAILPENSKNKFLSQNERENLVNFVWTYIVGKQDDQTAIPSAKVSQDLPTLPELQLIFQKFYSSQGVKPDYEEIIVMQQIFGKLERRGAVTDPELQRLEPLLVKAKNGDPIDDPDDKEFMAKQLALLEMHRRDELKDSEVYYVDGGLMSHADLVIRTLLRIDTRRNVNHGAENKHLLHTEKFANGNYPFFMPDGSIRVIELNPIPGLIEQEQEHENEKKICEFINRMRHDGYVVESNPKWPFKAYNREDFNNGKCREDQIGDLYVPSLGIKKTYTLDDARKGICSGAKIGKVYFAGGEKVDFRLLDEELEEDDKHLKERRKTLSEQKERLSNAPSRAPSEKDIKKMAAKKSRRRMSVAEDDHEDPMAKASRAQSLAKKSLGARAFEGQVKAFEDENELTREHDLIDSLIKTRRSFYSAFVEYNGIMISQRLIYPNDGDSKFDELKSEVAKEFDKLLEEKIAKARDRCLVLWQEYYDAKYELDLLQHHGKSVFEKKETDSKVTEFDKIFSAMDMIKPKSVVLDPVANRLVTPAQQKVKEDLGKV